MFLNKLLTITAVLLFFSATAVAGNGPGTQNELPGNACLLTSNPNEAGPDLGPVAPLPTPQRRIVAPFAGHFNPAVIQPTVASSSFIHVAEMIRGQVPGLWITGTLNNYQLRVRGAIHPPLIVIDGVWLNSDNDEAVNLALQMVNPAEVSSVEVLKSVADTNIYGPRGANGVIVIRTMGDLPIN